ncbi:MAG: AAA family ATPase, partial [Desulfobacteraceae bacterium]|nr:AAA family ATPase [Desulfobacteraceae bacterium]
DYVISCGPNIFPVEVKAGRSGTLRSLHQFVACGKSRKAVRFDMNQPSRQQVTYQVPTAGKHQKTFFELLSLPLYGVGKLERLLEPE